MTHADLDPASALASRPANDEEFYEQLMQQHSADISIEPHIFRLDSHQAMGAEMKLLRQTIATIKKHVIEVWISHVHQLMIDRRLVIVLGVHDVYIFLTYFCYTFTYLLTYLLTYNLLSQCM